jgi:arsenate reductase
MQKLKVLFICTGNSARSQMAEGLLKQLGGERFEVYSAGLDPKGVNQLTVQVMNEIGIDIGDQYSKSVKEFMGRMQFDDAIIVCRRSEENCPSLSADAKRLHRWLFDDPATFEGTREAQLAKFREIRDQIQTRMRLWLEETAEITGLELA